MKESIQRKTLSPEVAHMIQGELENIPEKYLDNFCNPHHGYAIILEEVRELEQEVFFGEKKARKQSLSEKLIPMSNKDRETYAITLHKERMREECVQIAAMCVRFIQELT